METVMNNIDRTRWIPEAARDEFEVLEPHYLEMFQSLPSTELRWMFYTLTHFGDESSESELRQQMAKADPAIQTLAQVTRDEKQRRYNTERMIKDRKEIEAHRAVRADLGLNDLLTGDGDRFAPDASSKLKACGFPHWYGLRIQDYRNQKGDLLKRLYHSVGGALGVLLVEDEAGRLAMSDRFHRICYDPTTDWLIGSIGSANYRLDDMGRVIEPIIFRRQDEARGGHWETDPKGFYEYDAYSPIEK
jgi:hypothetical protein